MHDASTEHGQRPKLNLLPRLVPVPEKGEASPTPADEIEEGEIRNGEPVKSEMSKEQAERKVDEDIREFFAIRNLDEADDYFIKLPPEYYALLVEKVVMRAIESKEADAQLVAGLLERGCSKGLRSPVTLQGFMSIAELLDDIAIDALKACILWLS